MKRVTIHMSVRLDEVHAEALEQEMLTEEGREFLSRIVMYGLTRRSIYTHLREEARKAVQGNGSDPIGEEVRA